MNRRQFLQAGIAYSALSTLGCQTTEKQIIYLSAQANRDAGNYGLGWVQPNNQRHHYISENFRGHGISAHPIKTGHGILYARRPGTTLFEANLRSGIITAKAKAQPQRHFFGHGCFSETGDVLFTSESDFATGAGKIGIRDADTYQHIGEFDSHGVGPHEIALMPDGKTLVIANGGLRTHPDNGREVLNLDDMDSRLSYIDLSNGQKIDDFKVAEPKASIRHLSVANDGSVAVALQMQRLAAMHSQITPLLAIHKPGQALATIAEPKGIITAMNDYAGSACINNQHRTLGITSPRGNLAAFWHLDTQAFLGSHQLQDVCGITVTPDEATFVISNSFGQIRHLDASTLKEDRKRRITIKNARWDNHLIAVTI